MIFAPTDGGAAADTPSDDHGVGDVDEAPLSAPPSCGALRRGTSCGLDVLHDGDHVGGERSWPRGRRERRRRDDLAAAVERLREEVAQPLEV